MTLSITAIPAATLMVLVSTPAWAVCSCDYQAACVAYRESAAIFTAKAMDLVRDSGSGSTRVRLTVGQILSGRVPHTIEFPTSAECDRSFELGEEYLVYASKHDDRLLVTACSRVLLLSEAAADLDVIRSRNARRPDASVHGYIIIDGGSKDSVKLSLRGAQGRYQQDTPGGPYEFNGLKPGSYELRISHGKDFFQRLSFTVAEQSCKDLGDVHVPWWVEGGDSGR